MAYEELTAIKYNEFLFHSKNCTCFRCKKRHATKVSVREKCRSWEQVIVEYTWANWLTCATMCIGAHVLCVSFSKSAWINPHRAEQKKNLKKECTKCTFENQLKTIVQYIRCIFPFDLPCHSNKHVFSTSEGDIYISLNIHSHEKKHMKQLKQIPKIMNINFFLLSFNKTRCDSNNSSFGMNACTHTMNYANLVSFYEPTDQWIRLTFIHSFSA